MTTIVLKDGAMELEFVADDPEEKFLTTGVSWNQYEDLLTKLGDHSRYRVTYLEGVLEIMSPSQQFPLMTCESSTTRGVDSSVSSSTIPLPVFCRNFHDST